MFSFQAKFKVNTFHIRLINCHELCPSLLNKSCLNVCVVVLIYVVLTKKGKKKNIY